MLLFDETESLLRRRVRAHSAKDRCANLETDLLLRRIETCEGVLLVTTNHRFYSHHRITS